MNQFCFINSNPEDISAKQIIRYLVTLSKKSENAIANTVKKPHNFVPKTKNYLQKNPEDLEKLHPDFLEEGKEEMSAVGIFCQNQHIVWKIILISKINSYLTMAVFFK